MNIEQMIAVMNPEIYQALKSAVEIGKWPNGEALTSEQKEAAIQAVMIYSAEHDTPSDEPFKVQADGSVALGKSEATKQFNQQQSIIIKSPAND
ncbi:MAG: DUF1315 family protein [Kangiellaceae bacterium]|jgi:uncharacterized protein YeaC (DUF1315 family)|nr:DUF1315 family protein [Kangiellaceae bacterium]